MGYILDKLITFRAGGKYWKLTANLETIFLQIYALKLHSNVSILLIRMTH